MYYFVSLPFVKCLSPPLLSEFTQFSSKQILSSAFIGVTSSRQNVATPVIGVKKMKFCCNLYRSKILNLFIN